MFASFFPRPKLLFWSFVCWTAGAVILWYAAAADLRWAFGLAAATDTPAVGVAVFWSVFGTGLLALVGIKLPNLEFRNQRVEAAYRKELVYGEDNEDRARPQTVKNLFAAVRRNYFTLYFHYAYFNIARIFYLQADNIFPFVILAPVIVAGKITLGVMNQILNAFGQVRSSFQYLVTSWPTIIELLSIHKRLRTFEAAIADEPLPWIEGRGFHRNYRAE